MRRNTFLRGLILSAGLIAASANAVLACPGQTGKAIFIDNFKDDSGGWDLDNHETYASGGLQIAADSSSQSTGSLNLTFNATEGDYCAVIAFPATPAPDNNPDYAALSVLASEYKNRYQFGVDTTGSWWISVLRDGNWQTIATTAKTDDLKTAPGAENELRVIIKDQKLTFFLNGKQVKVLRAQISDKANKFGFFAGSNNAKPTEARTSIVKSYSVTEAP